MASEIGHRLKQIRARFNESQQSFAERTGLHRSYIGDIEAGRRDPSFAFFQVLVDVINVNPTWLLKGLGPMFLPAPEGSPEPAPEEGAAPVVTLRCREEPAQPLTPGAQGVLEEDQMVRNVVELMAEMSPEQRRDICRIAEKEKLLTELLQERSGKAAG